MNAMGIKRFRQLRGIVKYLKAGVSITQACKGAGIEPSTLWRWRKQKPKLDLLVHAITESRVMMVEDAHFKKAMEGSVVAQIFFLCNRAPDRWHHVADIKNIIINQQSVNKPDDRFKEAPRFIFTSHRLEEKQGEQKT